MSGFSGGEGGVSSSSSAASSSGDITSKGDRAYGGINIGASNGFQLNTTTLMIAAGAVGLFFLAKARKWI